METREKIITKKQYKKRKHTDRHKRKSNLVYLRRNFLGFLKRRANPSNYGVVNIKSSLNNCIMTLQNLEDSRRILVTASSGTLGFKQSHRSSKYASEMVGEFLAKKAIEYKIRFIEIRLNGVQFGRDSCVRAFRKHGLILTRVVNFAKISFGGCRPKKKRRI